MSQSNKQKKLPTFREYFTETVLLEIVDTPAGEAHLYGPRWKAIVWALGMLLLKLSLFGLLIAVMVLGVKGGHHGH